MSENVRRGYFDSDEKDFNEKNLEKLRKAQKDFYYLMNQNYPMQSIATFVGNHFAFSERQRMALIRATSSSESIKMVIEHSSSWINFVKNIFDESEEKFSFYDFTMKENAI